jgi:phospholipid/cholesterol/gamma-HCH transport system substrate-binding protein
VDGLTEANPVVLKGLKVGMVTEVGLNEDGSGSMMVEFNISNDDVKIPANSKAKIISSDFFGSKAIELVLGDTTVMAEPGAILASERQEDIATALRKELEPLKAKTEQLISGVDEVIENLQVVFSAESTKGLPGAFESLQNALKTFEKTAVRIDETIAESKERVKSILDNVNSISGNIEANNEKISSVINNFEALSDSLARVNIAHTILQADEAMTSLNAIMSKIEKGEGSIGMLVNNDSLHNQLVAATRELESLLNDMEANPDRYVHFSLFGRKEQKQFSKKELEQLEKALKEQQ